MEMEKFSSVDELLQYQPAKGTDVIEILVGYGTCGIAAGADKVYLTLTDEVRDKKLKNVVVKKVGCLGLCYSEPNVEVNAPGMPGVLYGKVDSIMALKMIEQHIIKKRILSENIFDKPYVDVLEK
jgi:(2Fe-2S) ferredoxin